MNVTSLTLTNFLSHDSTTLDLPSRGVVVVTGPNGAGKSSFVEAVAVAAWGKTLRGTAPWRDGQAGSVSIQTTDGLRVERSRSKGGKASLDWRRAGVDLVEYETSTKAQEALEAIIGVQDVWRRTSVFSSSDAAHFSLATDGERKRLLESILQLDRFDVALEACRRDLATVRQRVSAADKLVATLTARVDAAQQAVERAREEAQAVAPSAPVAQLGEDLQRLDASIAAYQADLAANQARRRQLELERTGLGLIVEDKARALTRIESGACPTCGQATRALADELRQELSAARTSQATQMIDLDALLSELREEAQELTDEARILARKRETLSAQLASARALASAHVRAQRALAQAEQEASRWQAQLGEAQSALAVGQAEQEELEACDRVLGLRGVRATLLGQALLGIEQVANGWLARLGEGRLRLRLGATTERKSGAVADAISLDVEGAGGGYGYRASSGGERRRLDIALLLALAEVASAVAGTQPGTLWVDEAFDALDSQGVAVVAEALQQIAETRCVVVVTHSEELAQAIVAEQRLRVVAGRLC